MTTFRRPIAFTVFLTIAVLCLQWTIAGQSDPPIPASEIVRKFVANEQEMMRARAGYSYQQDILVQELDSKNKIVGEFHSVSLVSQDATGKRRETTVSSPLSTLVRISMTPQDFENIRNMQTVALTKDNFEKYDIRYSGRETTSGVSCYVLEVKPKVREKGQNYFEGKLWVEDRDMHIVRSVGRAVPDIRSNGGENLFPPFDASREQIDGYWFPSSIDATDTLNFSSGPIRVRQIITFRDYKKS